MTQDETVDARFQRWASRFTEICSLPVDQAREDSWKEALTLMWDEDKTLALRWDNCIDGCCPTGDFVLLRLVHPSVNAAWMVTYFPEMIKAAQTHKTVIFTEDDDETED